MYCSSGWDTFASSPLSSITTELVVGGGIEVEVMAMAISFDVHVVLINYINV